MDFPSNFQKRFSTVAEIARRPSCCVVKATDSELGGREVALKVFIDRVPDGSPEIAAFEDEVQKLKQASHPTLVPVISAGCEDGYLFLSMELIEGPTLREVLEKNSGPFRIEQAVSVAQELAAGLHELHEQGVYHGHLDSRAILFKGESARLAGYYPKAIGRLQKSATSQGRFLVDPHYIAPEQLEDSASAGPSADIYSLSVLLYEMLTAQRPFEAGNPLQTAMLRLTKQPPAASKLRAEVPPLLNAAIEKGLSRQPGQRFKSMSDFVDAITGGKKVSKNPLAEAMSGPERISTETIAVSMSTEAIKELLRAHDSQEREKARPPVTAVAKSSDSAKAVDVSATVSGVKLDVAATVMGVQATDVLRPTFVAINGPASGQRWAMTSDQLLIGRDPSSQIQLEGKEILPRAAIAMYRGGETFVSAMADGILSVGDRSLGNQEEVQLNRGDVVKVGGHSLRYVAPGEVFSFKATSVERAIDKKQSRLARTLPLIAILAVVAVLLLVFSFQTTVDEKQAKAKRAESSLEAKQEAKVKELRMQGDELFRNGALIEPADDNARSKFQQILEIWPDDQYAKRRIAEIDDRVEKLAKLNEEREKEAQKIATLISDGERYLAAGDLIAPPGRNAKEAFQEVLRVDPENEVAKVKVEEINTRLRDALQRVDGLLLEARVLADNGQMVLPRGDSAFERIQEVLQIDPEHAEAKELLLDFAARSIFAGDQARSKADAKTMRRQYTVARVLGVAPQFIEERMKGAELMTKSSGSSVIIFSGGDKTADEKKPADGNYLDTKKIEQRVAELALKSQLDGSSNDRRFIELSGSKK